MIIRYVSWKDFSQPVLLRSQLLNMTDAAISNS